MRNLIAVCFVMSLFAPDVVAAEEKSFCFSIKSGKLSKGPAVVRVVQDDRVKLIWRSDQPAEIHLHGYNVTLDVTVAQAASVTVDCTATGRFPVTLHGGRDSSRSHKPLTYLEVYPK